MYNSIIRHLLRKHKISVVGHGHANSIIAMTQICWLQGRREPTGDPTHVYAG